MIRHLEKLRIGAIEHLEFMAEECGRRAHSLALSNYRDVENVHSSGVLSLDLDVDGR